VFESKRQCLSLTHQAFDYNFLPVFLISFYLLPRCWVLYPDC